MKKQVAVMLAAILGVCCLGGCAGKQETTVAEEVSTVVEEATVEETTETQASTAAEEEQSTAEEQTAGEVTDGTYLIDVESSSSMFQVERAELSVEAGNMTAVITLGGTGYTKLYMGTAEQAATAAEEECILFAEDENGAYTYTIPVAALDQPIDCAAFSRKKEEWYDRQLTFLSSTIKEAVAETAMADGTYTIELTFEGGSGKAQIVSPATITVEGDKVMATVQWNSPNYDYMVVAGEKYLPVNTEGDSVFEIPVSAFDEAMDVIGDTVAMSKAHEVEYTITFHSDTMKTVE